MPRKNFSFLYSLGDVSGKCGQKSIKNVALNNRQHSHIGWVEASPIILGNTFHISEHTFQLMSKRKNIIVRAQMRLCLPLRIYLF